MALDIPDGTPDRGPGNVVLCIVLTIFISLATITRITSKVVTRQAWWWDDLFALLSFATAMVLVSMVFAWREVGLGYHMELVAAISPQSVLDGSKYLFVATFFYGCSICFPKLSAVFFYARVFRSQNRAFRLNLWIVGLYVAAWLVSGILVCAFQCDPIDKAWNAALPGTCIDQYAWYLYTAILSTIIDFYILLLPVPMIWKLQITVRRRVYLLICFFMSYSVIVLSIGRIAAVVQVIPLMKTDLSWEFPVYVYWVALEAGVSIISINVPSGIALVKAIMRLQGRPLASSGGNSNSPTPYAGSNSGIKTFVSHGKYGYERRESVDQLVPHSGVLKAVRGNHADISLRDIKVQTDIRVISRE